MTVFNFTKEKRQRRSVEESNKFLDTELSNFYYDLQEVAKKHEQLLKSKKALISKDSRFSTVDACISFIFLRCFSHWALKLADTNNSKLTPSQLEPAIADYVVKAFRVEIAEGQAKNVEAIRESVLLSLAEKKERDLLSKLKN